jgi:hypothetical protein
MGWKSRSMPSTAARGVDLEFLRTRPRRARPPLKIKRLDHFGAQAMHRAAACIVDDYLV